MRRFLIPLVLALLVAGTCQPAAAFHKHGRWECGWHWAKGRWHTKQLIRCQAERKGLDPAKAVRVAKCESGLNPRAVSSSGTYLGLFQQHRGYWPGRAATYGFAGWRALNGRANAFVSLAMAASGGWGDWPVCGR